MTDEQTSPAPRRLSRTDKAMAELFTDAEASFRQGIDEARAWQNLQPRLDSISERGPRTRLQGGLLWTTVAVAAGLVLGWFGWQRFRPAPLRTVAAAASTLEQLSNPTTPTTLIRLASGKSRLTEGTEVDLGDGAQGTFVSDSQHSSLQLARGRLEIVVAHQRGGRTFSVEAEGYEFIVIGTHFTVAVNGPRVDLAVLEGRVAVHDATREVGVVEGGERWSSLDEASAIESPAPNTVRPSPPELSGRAESPTPHADFPSDPARCRDLLRASDARRAEQCYLEIAAGSGFSAEIALYEVARLRRDLLSKPSASLATLDEYESRFTSGSLAPEVRMARIDLLVRLGRVEEALRASEELLSTSSGRARTIELRLLRGNLLRDKRHDCAAAINEYQLIDSDPGPRGDQAQFARAGCLQQLGRTDEALQTYHRYLERPRPQQTERARRQLKSLQP